MIAYESSLVAIAVDPLTNCAACALAPIAHNVPDPMHNDTRGVLDAALDDALAWAEERGTVPACAEDGAWLQEPDLDHEWRLFDMYVRPTTVAVSDLDTLAASMSALRDELADWLSLQWIGSHPS